jgi:RNA polymerase sigma-70 factor, ECF subfamily
MALGEPNHMIAGVVSPEVGPRSGSAARPTDAVLVAAARAGERWAKEALFQRHSNNVIGLAYRLLGRDADVDDVVQDAYFQALSSLHRLREPHAFGSWLAGILVRRVQRVLRKKRLLRRLGLLDPDPIDPDLALAPDTSPETVAELRRIYGVLDALSTQSRLALVLRRVEGHSISEIATLLGCSISTVKRRLHEAEAALDECGREP